MCDNPFWVDYSLLSNCYAPGTELGAGDQKMCYTVSNLGVHHGMGKRPLNR